MKTAFYARKWPDFFSTFHPAVDTKFAADYALARSPHKHVTQRVMRIHIILLLFLISLRTDVYYIVMSYLHHGVFFNKFIVAGCERHVHVYAQRANKCNNPEHVHGVRILEKNK